MIGELLRVDEQNIPAAWFVPDGRPLTFSEEIRSQAGIHQESGGPTSVYFTLTKLINPWFMEADVHSKVVSSVQDVVGPEHAAFDALRRAFQR